MKGTVFVGLSGGVDSAVSAALLLKQGYEVVGVFIKSWHPDFIECNEEEERRDAMRIAAHLDIPFLTFDLESIYKKEVGDYMIAEYRAGRTPNPDVMCNKEVKFGAFLKKALLRGADFVATGHYAQVKPVKENFDRVGAPGERVKRRNFALPAKHLLRSTDSAKDQSYFLWTLNQKQLSKILFPVGHLKKSQVRALAKKFKLPVAEKKDSQGICFLGAVDLKNFLKYYIKEKKGKVVNEAGEAIGHHEGTTFYTLGERHGFVITKKTPDDKRYYVIDKDIRRNTLTVSAQPKSTFTQSLGSSLRSATPSQKHFSASLEKVNWISEMPKANKSYTAQIRYHGELLKCKVKSKKSKIWEVIFEKPVLVAPGQSIVLYDRDTCLGGGVVK